MRMPAEPVLAAFDLDGTLVDHHLLLPAGHERTVRELARRGVRVAIVTGRGLMTAVPLWKRLRLDTPIACFNGGWVGIPGERMLAARLLAEGEVRMLQEALAGFPGSICLYPAPDRWLMDRETEWTRGWCDFYRVPIEIDSAPFTAWHGTSHKMMVVGDPASLPAVMNRLIARFGQRFSIVLSQPDRFEILPTGIDKAWGLQRIAAALGVRRERVWAIGDADNDVGMVRWAGHGCAMGQATPALRRVARHILPAIAARGICALPLLMEREGMLA